MLKQRYHRAILPYLVVALILVVVSGLITACVSDNGVSAAQGLRTWLLVESPSGPLPVNQAINVRSRTEDAQHQVSHVELYAVELPTGQKNILIRSDPAPFDQTTFTASQVFVPGQPGHYVIKVVGYNKLGQWVESDYIGFDVQ